MTKVKLDRELFFSKISKMVRFVPSKTVIPAFDNFKLTVADGMMEILSADSTIQCKMQCPVSKSEPFSICVPAKLLVKTIALFRENEVIMSVKDETKIELKCGKSKYNITCDCFAKDFPIMPMEKVIAEITLSQFYLKASFKSAQKFVNEDHANTNLIGININEVNNKIVFTGADDTTMCRAAIKPISINSWSQIVCPTETANKVLSLLEDKGEVSIIHSGNMMRIFTSVESSDYFEVTSVTTNAKFPDSEKFFSKRPDDHYTINSLELLDAAKRLSLYSQKEDCSKITFRVISDTEIELYSEDPNLNKNGTETISYINRSSQKLEKTFNADNIIKILSIVESNDFNFYFNERPNFPSYIIPAVATTEEDVYSFLLTSMIK